MVCEQWSVKDVQGKVMVHSKVLFQHLSGGADKNDNTLSGWLISRPKFKARTSWIWSYRANYSTVTLQVIQTWNVKYPKRKEKNSTCAKVCKKLLCYKADGRNWTSLRCNYHIISMSKTTMILGQVLKKITRTENKKDFYLAITECLPLGSGDSCLKVPYDVNSWSVNHNNLSYLNICYTV